MLLTRLEHPQRLHSRFLHQRVAICLGGSDSGYRSHIAQQFERIYRSTAHFCVDI